MSLFRVHPIVEGHGEVEAVPLLIRRICTELFCCGVDVLPPLRQPRSLLVRHHELTRFAAVAGNKLRARQPRLRGLVLVLLDADNDLPCKLGPQLLACAKDGAGEHDAACVVANLEFETWFVAAASSLTEYLHVTPSNTPTDPESSRLRKKWVSDRFKGPSYSETLDQPRLTAKMNLAVCRANSPSFDKLCRELEKVVAACAEPPQVP